MFYIAKKFIGHAGMTLRPGEVFEVDGQDDKINWLLSQEAIAPAIPSFAPADVDPDFAESADPLPDLDPDFDAKEPDAEEPEGEEEAPIELEGLEGIVANAAEDAAEAAPGKGRRKK